jgi:hypothetical protein
MKNKIIKVDQLINSIFDPFLICMDYCSRRTILLPSCLGPFLTSRLAARSTQLAALYPYGQSRPVHVSLTRKLLACAGRVAHLVGPGYLSVFCRLKSRPITGY